MKTSRIAGYFCAFLYMVIVVKVSCAEASIAASDEKMAPKALEQLYNMVADYSPATMPPGINIGQDIKAPIPSTGAYLGALQWRRPNRELYKDGAWVVPFYDRVIAVKLGILRGSSLGDTYNVDPVAMVSDITNIDYGQATIYEYDFLGRAGCYATPSVSFYFAFTAKDLTIAKCTNGQPDYSFKKTITYQQWNNLWAQNAEKYRGAPVRDHYFIPQQLVRKEYMGDGTLSWTCRYGFVAAKSTPTFTNGGQPADFIEVGKLDQSGEHNIGMTESPVLKLIIALHTLGVNPWEWRVYEMVGKEMETIGQNIYITEPRNSVLQHGIKYPVLQW